MVVPLDLIKESLKDVTFIGGMDECLCRQANDCKDYPQDLGCLFLGEAGRVIVKHNDIDSAVDAETMMNAGIRCIQIHTGGMCHLDAQMTAQGLEELGTEDTDLVILENVGNLVCPAEFDTGACKNMKILSVPEGHDKPLKYPLMYETCDLLVINKVDVLEYFDFDCKKAIEYAKIRNPKIEILFVSAKTGEGIDQLADWILNQIKEWNQS